MINLAEILSAEQLIIELVRNGWRKSIDQNPLKNDPTAHYFRAINIENIVGRTFEQDYFRRVDIYPQREDLTWDIGLTALIAANGRIIRWEVFRHYSGSYPITVDPSEIFLTVESIGNYLKSWNDLH